MSDVSVSLGANKYGKAENRVVRIYRDTPRHEIVDGSRSSISSEAGSDAARRGHRAFCSIASRCRRRRKRGST